ncbi:hypothetical protein NM688_g5866 [Phlebia brevispora]|uniref:Uncharacterized protein n=1 Tax=Phlebia brevispora TaxID=194682 RepID=A0ACC1SNX5_9APHY|nr:hypothetical protein NM688_g5866 [Phlebia brevispora]
MDEASLLKAIRVHRIEVAIAVCSTSRLAGVRSSPNTAGRNTMYMAKILFWCYSHILHNALRIACGVDIKHIAAIVLWRSQLGLVVFDVTFCALRIYAISGKSRWSALIVLMLALVNVPLTGYGDIAPLMTLYAVPSLDIQSCVADLYQLRRLKKAENIILHVSAFVGVCFSVLAELIVQVVTWMKTAQIRHMLGHTATNLQWPLTMLLLRDGTLSFLFLGIFSILTQIPYTDVSLSDMSLPLVSIIVCRFLLCLRQVYVSNSPYEEGTQTLLARQSLHEHSMLVGNLGAPLDMGVAHDQDEGEDEPADSDVILISNDPLSVGLQSLTAWRTVDEGGFSGTIELEIRYPSV